MSRFTPPSRHVMSLFIAVPFVAAACSGTASETPTDEAVAAAVTEPAITDSVAEPGESADEPTWLDIELTNAETGETFTLASLAGGVVAIEPMAVWCTNCKAQQKNVQQVYDQIEASGVNFVSLGIDPGENPGTLAKYAERNGFDWTFAQSPVEFSRALSDLFGPQVLSAPSTPLIVLDETGEVVIQTVGFHGPDEVLRLLEEAAA